MRGGGGGEVEKVREREGRIEGDYTVTHAATQVMILSKIFGRALHCVYLRLC